MKTLREFDHDGSHFEIRALLADGVWTAKVLCDGNVISEPAIVSNDTLQAGTATGINLFEVIADELERLVKELYDLRVKRVS